ncbi:MAG TPA: hypothetical protein VFO52_06025 [Longimicrobiales bacterium]|nr:hypothetical protein [Longimicrobiales bacterium]
MSERQHPYDLVFSNAEMVQRLDAIAAEAEERGVDSMDADRALMLVSFGELLGTLLPGDAAPDVIQQVAWLIFHCFHYRAAGEQTFEIAEPVLRELLSTGLVAGPQTFTSSVSSGYVVLPRHRVWSRISEDAQAEAIDGFFFVDRHVLFVLGIMPGRPGFSIMALTAPAWQEETTSLAELKARPEGDDFSNVLPGGELQGHFAVTNPIEALKLAARCLWHLSRG